MFVVQLVEQLFWPPELCQWQFLFAVNCIEKETGNDPFKKFAQPNFSVEVRDYCYLVVLAGT